MCRSIWLLTQNSSYISKAGLLVGVAIAVWYSILKYGIKWTPLSMVSISITSHWETALALYIPVIVSAWVSHHYSHVSISIYTRSPLELNRWDGAQTHLSAKLLLSSISCNTASVSRFQYIIWWAQLPSSLSFNISTAVQGVNILWSSSNREWKSPLELKATPGFRNEFFPSTAIAWIVGPEDRRGVDSALAREYCSWDLYG